MQAKNKNTEYNTKHSKSTGITIFFWCFGFLLTLLLKLYFFVPDVISSIKNKLSKKEIASSKIGMRKTAENLASLHGLNSLGK
jgi:hypothetical protein